MSEINISIPYSLFKETFLVWFTTQIRSGFITSAERAMWKAKEYWVLFDTDLRKSVVSVAEELIVSRPFKPFADEFVAWAHENRDVKQDYNTPPTE